MYNKKINYKDYEGNEAVWDAWFHLTKFQVTELKLTNESWTEEYLNDLMERVKALKDCEDTKENRGKIRSVMKEMLSLVKELIRISYVTRVGNSVRHDEESLLDFLNSDAYSEFLLSLFEEQDNLLDFMIGTLGSVGKDKDEVRKMISETLESDE